MDKETLALYKDIELMQLDPVITGFQKALEEAVEEEKKRLEKAPIVAYVEPPIFGPSVLKVVYKPWLMTQAALRAIRRLHG
jgi:hypothetical protein